MNKKHLILIFLIVIILCVAIAFLASSDNENKDNSTIANNTTLTNNITDSAVDDTENVKQSSSEKTYDNWEKHYETEMYDAEGNPVYKSIISTSGGQNEPGIYVEYYSPELGPLDGYKIG